ncbi:hypothetical protein [Prevotella sp.]|uniref:hypothetical protein n=1 Tax=Prevotella sp. TaxID=59823 RepID=UPI0027E2C730|nr:hypothetical protein [Prevotella sp.]
MENVITKIVNKVGSDKVMHVETCALIAVVAKRCSGSVAIGAAVALGVGLLKELYDVATGEEFDWKDVAADAVGAVIGATM